jgi:Flp pilus assembly protein TadD
MLCLRTCWMAILLLACGIVQASELDEARDRMARGDTAGALQRLQQGLAREPANAQMKFLQGVALMDLGRDAQALEVFRQLNQAYPELPEPLNNIGLLHARAGQLESARQSLQDALRADPQHRAARVNLGQVYLMLAVQAWELASAGLPDPTLLRRLEGARAVLALPAR